MDTKDRIFSLITNSGMSMRTVAAKTGVTVATVSKWCKGVCAPKGKNLSAFCDLFDVSPSWLLFEEGVASTNDEVPVNQPSISVPLLSVEASCGGGSLVDSADIVRMIRFDEAYLRRHARGANPRTLNIITVRGDSMSPTVEDGDAVVIDVSDTTIKQDGVYAIQLGGYLYVKRIQITPTGVRILSDNSHYPPIDVGEQDSLTVAGKCYTGIVLKDL